MQELQQPSTQSSGQVHAIRLRLALGFEPQAQYRQLNTRISARIELPLIGTICSRGIQKTLDEYHIKPASELAPNLVEMRNLLKAQPLMRA
jgi:hypothetical protein